MLATGIIVLFLYTLGCCSRFPYMSVIDSGEIIPALGKIPVFTHFWIYGSVVRLPTRKRCHTKYRERFTGTLVDFSGDSFSLDSPNFSITSNRARKLAVSAVPQTCRFLAFDNELRAFDDVHSARAVGANLSFICLIVSDDDDTYLQLRSQALNLIWGSLIPTLLKSGHLIACVRVASSGIMRPDLLPKPAAESGALLKFGESFRYSQKHVDPGLSVQSNESYSIVSGSSTENLLETRSMSAEQPQPQQEIGMNDFTEYDLESSPRIYEDTNLHCCTDNSNCNELEPPCFCTGPASFSEIDFWNHCDFQQEGMSPDSIEDSQFTVAQMMDQLFKGCPPH